MVIVRCAALCVSLALIWLVGGAAWSEDAPPGTRSPTAKPAAKKKGKPSFEPGPNDVVLECEALTLTDAEIVEAADASGGKCIQFSKETSKAEKETTLKAGRYAVDVYMKCQDLAHDTIYLSVPGKEKIKVFPSHAHLPQTSFVRVPVDEDRAKPLLVETEKDQAVKIALLARETGMLLDRIVLRKVEESAKP